MVICNSRVFVLYLGIKFTIYISILHVRNLQHLKQHFWVQPFEIEQLPVIFVTKLMYLITVQNSCMFFGILKNSCTQIKICLKYLGLIIIGILFYPCLSVCLFFHLCLSIHLSVFLSVTKFLSKISQHPLIADA